MSAQFDPSWGQTTSRAGTALGPAACEWIAHLRPRHGRGRCAQLGQQSITFFHRKCEVFDRHQDVHLAPG